MLIAFLTFVIVLYGTPGPATLSLAASGATFGFRRSVPYLIGILMGIAINLAVTLLGLSYLFARFPLVFTTFKVLSLLYALYLAYRIAGTTLGTPGKTKAFRFYHGVLLNSLNPKAYLAAVAVFTQFASASTLLSLKSLLMACAILVIVTVIDLAWCYLGELLTSLLSAVWPRRIMAGLLAASVLLPLLML